MGINKISGEEQLEVVQGLLISEIEAELSVISSLICDVKSFTKSFEVDGVSFDMEDFIKEHLKDMI